MTANPSRPPLQGYNHNIRYGSRVYHVQTEDSGIDHPHLFTHLFFEGVIIATARTDYSELATQPAHEPRVRKLMQEQHKRLMKELRAGKLDDKIKSLFGPGDTQEEEEVVGPTEKNPSPAEEADVTRATDPNIDSSIMAESTLPNAAGTHPDASATPNAGSGPPSMAELAAAAGVGGEDDQRAAGADPARAKAGSHPVATWLDPGTLEADESRTLRMVVGASSSDEADTYIGSAPAPDTDPSIEAQRNIAAPARARLAGPIAAPHAPPPPAIRSRAPEPDLRAQQQPARAAPPRVPIARTQPASPPGPTLGSRPAPGRPIRVTGAYGSSGPSPSRDRSPTSAARRRAGQSSESGVYQITVGGAQPLHRQAAPDQPRVIARPAIIVDRAPNQTPPEPPKQALSGASTRGARDPNPTSARPPADPPGKPQTRTLPSIFGSDLISERSLDEVILQYLSEDQD